MEKDEFGMFARERVESVIDAALEVGLSFDQALEELRYLINEASDNRDDWAA